MAFSTAPRWRDDSSDDDADVRTDAPGIGGLRRAGSHSERLAVPGGGRGSYDLSFIDYENEWEREDIEREVDSSGSDEGESDLEELQADFAAFWQSAIAASAVEAGRTAAAASAGGGTGGPPAWPTDAAGNPISAERLARLDDHLRRQEGLSAAGLRHVVATCLFSVASVRAEPATASARGDSKVEEAEGGSDATGPALVLNRKAGKRVVARAESSSRECSVCLESFEAGNDVLHLPCAHTFHEKCLHPWFRRNTKCPYCRAQAVPDSDSDS